jgi:fatty-acyl-CoA synthase
MGHFDQGLDKNQANFTSLSPLSFIKRSAAVFPDRPAVVHGGENRITGNKENLIYTWSQTYDRAKRLASALNQHGVSKGDVVSLMAPNIPALYEAHFGVLMCGGILNAMNYRLDAETIAFILSHGEAKVLITDTEFSPTIKQALAKLNHDILVIDIDDPYGPGGEALGDCEYEDFLLRGDPDFNWALPDDEWDAVALNYTSGTTGNPKGVVYHSRGSYLLAMGNVLTWSIPPHARYLWTLPMFHCNGWCFPWTLAAISGTSVCLRNVSAKNIFDAIADQAVTHFCGAPIVLNMLINAALEDRRELSQTVEVMTAAAPPPASVLQKMEEDGFHITHVYGLTEVYGPAVVCAWNEDWDVLSPEERAAMKSRQGVNYHVLEDVAVVDPKTMQLMPKDGESMGEIMMRGNVVMRGYFKNQTATDEAFEGGWFHTGDLGVWYEDGYIQLKDRSKDIIISGGENISTIEIEDVLFKHEAILEAAVVAKPDEKWGETPCAFVMLKPDAKATSEEIITFCRDHMAHFKCPRHIVFGPLSKTSTGKVQKFVLREQARDI